MAVSLATALAKSQPVTLLDCDVEEPNSHLLLGVTFTSETLGLVPSIEIDQEKCTGCGKCAEACRFNAIGALASGAMFFEELCHGCMGCVLACPSKAIVEAQRRTGIIRSGQTGQLTLHDGLLDVGAAMATGLIHLLRKKAVSDKITIIDAPPGVSCAMINTVQGCDHVILVTEPTPFGLNDMSLAAAALRELDVPFSVIVNRADDDRRIDEYCEREGIAILTHIPHSRVVAELYSRGEMPYDADEEFTQCINELVQGLNEN